MCSAVRVCGGGAWIGIELKMIAFERDLIYGSIFYILIYLLYLLLVAILRARLVSLYLMADKAFS